MSAHEIVDGVDVDVKYEDDRWIEDINAEKLIMELYDFRHGSQHTSAGEVEQPFLNVPQELMHKLDGFFLAHT